MLVVGRLDDSGPTALKGSLAIYPWGVAPGWYEPGPSALLKGAHPLQSWRLHHRGSEARQGKTARQCVFPDGSGPACGRNSNHAAVIKERILLHLAVQAFTSSGARHPQKTQHPPKQRRSSAFRPMPSGKSDGTAVLTAHGFQNGIGVRVAH